VAAPARRPSLTDEEDLVQALDRVATPIVWSMTRRRHIFVVAHACVLSGRYADPLAAAPLDADRAPSP
jgi:hypothetical protein